MGKARSMYIHTGYKKFPCAHDVEVGWLVNFFYEGDDEISSRCSATSLAVFSTTTTTPAANGDSDDDNEEDEGQQNL
jgi:hypothetical protein